MFPFPIIAPGNSKPNAFSFTNVANAGKSTLYTSNTITPTGYDSPALVSISGGEYSINGGTWTSLSTYIKPGQTITVRATSSSSWGTAFNVSISIDTTITTWTITTGPVSAGAWDTGWTAGSWTVYTPQFFNWYRVQLWAPGGGGGGNGGLDNSAYGTPGTAGGAGGNAQFAGGPYALGGGGGGGGGAAVMFNNGSGVWGADGSVGTAGGYGNGDGGTTGGGAAGGAGGRSPKNPSYPSPGYGGNGGAGGYCIKTYYWGQIAPNTGFSAYVQGPGGGGAGGMQPSFGYRYPSGSGGGYGRIYIDWG